MGVFDDARMVVQLVDGSNDIGKDLYVDLADQGIATGELIAVQVKSGVSYRRADGNYAIPCDEHDVDLWARSSVPIFGLVYDPERERLHWINLTAWARSQPPTLPQVVPVSSTWALDERTLPSLVNEARAFLAASGPPALVGLVDTDPTRQLDAVHDAFALGRRDPRPLLLLGASVRYLDAQVLPLAIQILTLCVGHGDISWSPQNWIDEAVKAQVRSRLDWSYEDTCLLLAAPQDDEWRRGGLGQDVAALVGHGWAPDVSRLLERIAVDTPAESAWPAVMLLVEHHGESALSLLESLVERSAVLRAHPMIGDLRAGLREHGYLSLW